MLFKVWIIILTQKYWFFFIAKGAFMIWAVGFSLPPPALQLWSQQPEGHTCACCLHGLQLPGSPGLSS